MVTVFIGERSIDKLHIVGATSYAPASNHLIFLILLMTFFLIILRAAQTYSIPRKTLRNWMKRLHIKSQFPMPKQLKEAAIRKKNNTQVRGEKIKINGIEFTGIV